MTGSGRLSALMRKSNPGGDAKLESLLRLFESQVPCPRQPPATCSAAAPCLLPLAPPRTRVLIFALAPQFFDEWFAVL
jgi:hypothetical protein